MVWVIGKISCSDEAGVMQNLSGCQHHKLRQAPFWILFFALSQLVLLWNKLNIPRDISTCGPHTEVQIQVHSLNSLGGSHCFTQSNPRWTLDRLWSIHDNKYVTGITCWFNMESDTKDSRHFSVNMLMLLLWWWYHTENGEKNCQVWACGMS